MDRQTQTAGDTTTYKPVYAGMNIDTATFTGNDTVYAGGGADWVLAGAGDDWVDGGQGNDVIFGNTGADILQGGTGDDVIDGDNRERIYYFRLIVPHNRSGYSAAGIHQTRDHAGNSSPERDSIPGPHGLAGWLGLENRGMKRMAGSRQTKVRHGGTPANGVWKMAA